MLFSGRTRSTVGSGLFACRLRFFSNLVTQPSSVVISKSRDIFANLSLEDWIFDSFAKQGSLSSWYHLLLWTNESCVVIGKHQNPWNEVRVSRCLSMDIPIARRKSGGGTVYHDLGNLNLCFLSDPKSHSRKRNNQFIIDVIAKNYGIKCAISERDNLVTQDGGFKVSGTASKLTPKSTYHHCTLLVQADLTIMNQIIWKGSDLVENKATPSVHSSVVNLKELCPQITMNGLIADLADEFAKNSNYCKIHKVMPSGFLTPEIDGIYRELRSWDWIYGKTPKFIVEFSREKFRLKMTIYHGIVQEVECSPPLDPSPLIGTKFTPQDFSDRLGQLTSIDYSLLATAKKCFLDTVVQIYS